MSLWTWLFGDKPDPKPPAAIVTVGVSSDDWLDWMLDELDEKDARANRKRYGHNGKDYYDD